MWVESPLPAASVCSATKNITAEVTCLASLDKIRCRAGAHTISMHLLSPASPSSPQNSGGAVDRVLTTTFQCEKNALWSGGQDRGTAAQSKDSPICRQHPGLEMGFSAYAAPLCEAPDASQCQTVVIITTEASLGHLQVCMGFKRGLL